MMEEGLLRPQDLSGLDFGSDPVDIDYGKLFASREKCFAVLSGAG